jgi:hypothetical protein
MQRALTCVLCLSTCAAFAPAGSIPSPSSPHTPKLTVVLNVTGAFSAQAASEMQHETAGILKEAGLNLDWLTLSEASKTAVQDLVVVKFNGACVLDPESFEEGRAGNRGEPLAFTYSADGAVQPFSEVACNRVAAAVRSALCTCDFQRADLFLGRALGRVVAHELVHILTKSQEHGPEGVAKASLSGKDLISQSLPLSAFDLHRLRQVFSQHPLAHAGD